MTDILQLIRQDLRSFKPYDSNREDTAGIWLDANELPFDDSPNQTDLKLNRYPSMNPTALLTQLASLYQVDTDQLLITRGSDDGIDLLIRLFCNPFKDAILYCPPTFSMYGAFAKIQGVQTIEVPLVADQGFSLDIKAIESNIAKIIFICSPNNPTGNLISTNEIIGLCKRVKNKAIVVVDEAYIEFAKGGSITSYLKQNANLVVLRTLSKAFGVAGIRCGSVIANKEFIRYLKAIIPPYALSSLTLHAAFEATTKDRVQDLSQKLELIEQQKLYLQEKLSLLPIVKKVWGSDANFLLVQFEEANKVMAICAKSKVYLRNMSDRKGLENCIRISIGTPVQNERLLEILKQIGE